MLQPVLGPSALKSAVQTLAIASMELTRLGALTNESNAQPSRLIIEGMDEARCAEVQAAAEAEWHSARGLPAPDPAPTPDRDEDDRELYR